MSVDSNTTLPAYAPCPHCGCIVVTGLLASGELISLEVSQRCYVIDWLKGDEAPRLHQSRAYPQHCCPGNVEA